LGNFQTSYGMEGCGPVSNGPLSQHLSVVRSRLEVVVTPGLPIAFDNDPEAVGTWLRAAADAVIRREFVLPDDGQPETLYLWMNDFPANTDAWTLTAFGMGPERVARSAFDWRDALIGDEIGSGLRIPDLTLTGMEEAQEWFARGNHEDAEVSAVHDVVLSSAFDLVARSLPNAGKIPFRVAMSCSEDWRVCVWEATSAEGIVRIWQSDGGHDR
jgi:hypothetical protein